MRLSATPVGGHLYGDPPRAGPVGGLSFESGGIHRRRASPGTGPASRLPVRPGLHRGCCPCLRRRRRDAAPDPLLRLRDLPGKSEAAGVGRAAVRAEPAIRPALRLESLFCRVVVGERFEELDDRQPLAVRPARSSLRHPVTSPFYRLRGWYREVHSRDVRGSWLVRQQKIRRESKCLLPPSRATREAPYS